MIQRIRLLLWCLAVVLTGCAHYEPPPGGPDDETPPELLLSRPDSLAVVADLRGPVVLVFTERLSERQLEQSVLVSPRTSPVVVDHSGDQIRVSLRRGWVPGTIYHVTVRSEVQDLFNNALGQPVRLVFSTGPAIPDTRLAGTVLDRITGRPDTEARVEAIRRADSLVYAAPTDSAGRFEFPHIPEGEYQVRAYRDVNVNRALDVYEARDTALVAVTAGELDAVRLAVVSPDTLPPKAAAAQVAGPGRVEVRFDDYLDPEQALAPAAVQIVGPDGALVPVARVAVGEAGARAAAPDTAAADTAAADAAPPPRLPAQSIVVELAEGATLTAGAEYTVRVRGVRNVVGLPGDSEVELEAPPAPAAPTPAAAPGDQQGPPQPVPPDPNP